MAKTPGLNLPFGIDPVNAVPVDSNYGPYSATSQAISSIPLALRYDGLTVQVTGLGEYHWLQSDLSDGGLIPKTSGSGFDVFVTGGTYTAGTATFINNTGGTFTVTGFTTGSTSSSGIPTYGIVRCVYLVQDASDVASLGGATNKVYNTFQSAYDAAISLQASLGGSNRVAIMVGNTDATIVGGISLTGNWNTNVVIVGVSKDASRVGSIVGDVVTGNGRTITVTMQNVTVTNITSITTGTTGNGGTITINGLNVVITSIQTSSNANAGTSGNVIINASFSTITTITTSTSGSGTGNGGTVTINGVGNTNSTISTQGNKATGNGGAVTINGNHEVLTITTSVSATTAGNGGSVTITGRGSGRVGVITTTGGPTSSRISGSVVISGGIIGSSIDASGNSNGGRAANLLLTDCTFNTITYKDYAIGGGNIQLTNVTCLTLLDMENSGSNPLDVEINKCIFESINMLYSATAGQNFATITIRDCVVADTFSYTNTDTSVGDTDRLYIYGCQIENLYLVQASTSTSGLINPYIVGCQFNNFTFETSANQGAFVMLTSTIVSSCSIFADNTGGNPICTTPQFFMEGVDVSCNIDITAANGATWYNFQIDGVSNSLSGINVTGQPDTLAGIIMNNSIVSTTLQVGLQGTGPSDYLINLTNCTGVGNGFAVVLYPDASYVGGLGSVTLVNCPQGGISVAPPGVMPTDATLGTYFLAGCGANCFAQLQYNNATPTSSSITLINSSFDFIGSFNVFYYGTIANRNLTLNVSLFNATIITGINLNVDVLNINTSGSEQNTFLNMSPINSATAGPKTTFSIAGERLTLTLPTTSAIPVLLKLRGSTVTGGIVSLDNNSTFDNCTINPLATATNGVTAINGDGAVFRNTMINGSANSLTSTSQRFVVFANTVLVKPHGTNIVPVNYSISSYPKFRNSGSVTVSNTTVKTSLMSAASTATGAKRIKANSLRAGMMYRLSANGFYGGSAGTMNIIVALSSTTIATTSATTLPAVTGEYWAINNLLVRVVTTGTSGTIIAAGTFDHTEGTTSAFSWKMGGTGTITVNTGTDLDFDLNVTFSSGGTGNNITCTNLLIEEIGVTQT